jgi:hypothetical protein
MPLTRLDLVSIPRVINVYLRFGSPTRTLQTGAQRRCVYIAPEDIFCRMWWERNYYGTTRWELVILQAKAPHSPVQKIAGITPGAAILLSVEGKRQVKTILQLISTLERQGIAPVMVAPTYWRVAHNRLAGRGEVGPYGADRHAAETSRWRLQ